MLTELEQRADAEARHAHRELVEKADALFAEGAKSAHLIAAAPEMLPLVAKLAALPIPDVAGSSHSADDVPVYGLDGVYITHGDVRAARTALAKAEGKT